MSSPSGVDGPAPGAGAPAPDPAAVLRGKLAAALERWRDKARGKVFRLKQAALDTAKADELRLFGETLKMHLAEVPRKADRVRLPNMFGGPDLEIPLDPKIPPVDNMRRYFKDYHKAGRGAEEVARRLAAEEKAMSRMERISAEVAAAPDLAALEALEKRLQELNLFPRPVKMREKVEQPAESGPKRFVSADGFDILVGRNAEENAQLSFRLAHGNDWWFHAQGQAGSHVVVRMPRGRELTQETLLDAATLAAYHSKLRGRPVAEITYTQAKHVTRPRRGPVGLAIVQRFKTVRLDIDPRRLERLMEPQRRLAEE